MEYIISTQSLCTFNNLTYQDINIEKNKVTFISGPSGCGKSTLFKTINGTITPNSGTIYFNDINIATIKKIELCKNVTLVSQMPYLFNGSIKDNFEQFHQYHQSVCPSDEQIKNLLNICCIDSNIATQKLSGGERQRVYLSIALSLNQKVLLLDEPTSALDYDLAIKVLNNIIDYTKKNNITLVIISHDITIQNILAENIIQLGGK